MIENKVEKLFGDQYDYFYIIDAQNHEILYGNERIEQLFGKAWRGETCFHFFHQLDHPCPKCDEYKGAGIGDYYLESLDRYFWIISKAIIWDNREARLFTAVDITRKVKEQQRLEKKLEIEKKHKELLTQFVASGDREEALGNSLKLIGQYTQAEGCRLLQLDEQSLRIKWIYSWKREDNSVCRQEELLQDQAFVQRLKEEPRIVIHHVDQLEDESKEKSILTALGVKKMIAIPIWRFNQIYGYLAVYKDKCDGQEEPEELNLLQMFVHSLENILQQEQIKEQERQLKEYEKIRQELFSNISHEFKTPLNVINTTIQVLNQVKIHKPEEFLAYYSRYEDELRINTYRMLRLLDNMLDLTKINTGYFAFDPKIINIVVVLEDVVDHVRQFLADKSNVRIIFDTDEEELYVSGSVHSLQRVLLNLLANGVKFASQSEQFTVRLEHDDQWIYWFVDNQGSVVPTLYQEVIFQEFVQVEKTTTRQTEGCGIGLAVSRALVELHGGSIYLDQEYNEGCRFVIQLPRVNKEEQDREYYQLDKQDLLETIQMEFSDIYEIQ